MNTFSLRVLAANKTFYEGHCTKLIFTTYDGECEIMAHHENMMITVSVGAMRFEDAEGNMHVAITGVGFVQVVNNRVLLLADTVERPDEIDIRRAQEAKERAEEQLRQQQSIVEYHHSQASLARAMARLKQASKNI